MHFPPVHFTTHQPHRKYAHLGAYFNTATLRKLTKGREQPCLVQSHKQLNPDLPTPSPVQALHI